MAALTWLPASKAAERRVNRSSKDWTSRPLSAPAEKPSNPRILPEYVESERKGKTLWVAGAQSVRREEGAGSWTRRDRKLDEELQEVGFQVWPAPC